ncbi:hypothetical protein BJV82DRAFT_662734 [Fennellomyces sp. T-0311]|nr:hypothetical protein BJV82DRAFT_662734 [Fennellomyces sp. T-0311]
MRNLKELLRAFLQHLARLFGFHRRKPGNSCHDDPERQHSDDVDDDDIADDNSPPTCGCGRVLKQGWACPDCRTNCSRCGRALAVDEPCDRCSPPEQQQQQQIPHR